MSVEYVLKVSGIDKIYKVGENKILALKKVDFYLNHGEFVAIMGSSGSGKSTLLHILGGLDSPTSGKIFMDGIEIKNYYKEPYATEYRRNKIGFVFQFYNLLHALTVEDNVALPLILKNEDPSKIKKITREMLKDVGLYEWRLNRTIELSGGQQQRVALARALITSPSILLADEPTGNLDSKAATEVMELIIKLKIQLGQSIVLVTHDPKIASYADRVLFFHDGQIVDEYVGEINVNRAEKASILLNKLQNLII